MGAITPLGMTIDEYWGNLVAGKSGIAPGVLCDYSDYPCKIAGEVPEFDAGDFMDRKESRRIARFSQMAVAAAGLAIENGGLDLSRENPERLGVVMGNGNGGFPVTEENARIMMQRGGMRVSPFFIPMILPNMAAANVSRLYGLKGYTSTVITACAAGNQAIGEATEAVRRGAADVILGGGCEAGICQLALGGFNVIKALTRSNDEPEKASRPFDAKRDGFVPAEAAAVFVIESLEHAIDRARTCWRRWPATGCPPTPSTPFSRTRTGPARRARCAGRWRTRAWASTRLTTSTPTARQRPRTTTSRRSR